jgi:hypothetical protein
VFGTFRTSASYEQQWNAVIDEFQELGNIDLGAAFPESQAEIGLGYVRAGFAFGGNPTSLDYRPTANEVVLNTGFTQIVPANGLPFTVSDGVFNFRNVEIPQGVTVVGQGPNPMVWLCSGDFKVSGTLTVRGGNGARVDTLNSANFAKAGGIGVCGGGNGGDGTPSPNTRDLRGGTGRGPLQEAGKGGRGGYLACISGCYTGTGYNSSGGGSGGGGGTLATQGDPNWGGTTPATINPNTPPTANTSFQQLRGFGGTGCSGGSGTRSGFLNGVEPGDLVFTDSRTSNNFWGSGIDVFQNLRITGELAQPVGGGGGGGGGDTSNNFNCSLTGGDPVSDYSGGGGGGGGGVLIVKCLGNIDILASGNINANGGNGGGGEQVGSCGEAGGGGGGAGGMVILMSAQNIRIEAHGSTVTNRFAYQANAGAPFGGLDYSFAVSADGGVCLTGGFGSVNISNKYPAAGATMLTGAIYDGDPLGGLGGMGIVQLMVPPGIGTSTDGTNTRLDDNIRFFRPGTLGTANEVEYLGAQKEQLLAWRGFPNAQGIPVSDAGTPISLGKNEGDIRPSPTLLPVPFNPQSRVRSNWIDTGSSGRRDLAAADGLPRGVVTAGGAAIAGPRYEFGGTNTTNGFVSYTPVGSTSVNINYPQVGSALPLARVEAGASYLGQPAYRITLASAGLPSGSRYAQYEAELRNDVGSTIASYRILQHTEQELLVAVGEDLLPTDATQVAIRAKFFKIITDGSEGLGRAALFAGQAMPLANVRIGFAFHVDPNPANLLNGRFPNTSLQAFQYDLEDPALLSWLATNQPRYVMWDVLFDMSFKPGEQLSSSTPRPELHYLRLPFRF